MKGMPYMRWFQVALFLLGALSFLAALGFIGRQTGEDLWKAGVAFMVSDIAAILLWPAKSRA
jgi:hypothetical protein